MNYTKKIDSKLSARITAIEVLQDIFSNQKSLDVSFSNRAKVLKDQDRSFCFSLINFVLRKCIAIDAVADSLMKKPFKQSAIERQILRIGLAQLFFMESVEEFACIHTSVEIAKIKKPHSAKVINAVLREAQRTGFDFLEENYDLMNEIPQWISEELNKDYPQKAASLKSAMLTQGNIYVRLRDKVAKSFLDKNAKPVKYLPGAWVLNDKVDIHDIPKLDEFSVYVQDIASQLVSYILARRVELDGNSDKETKILDLCAAPGGKTIHLLDLLPYANITACDNKEKRLEKLKSNLSKACPDEQKRYSVVLNDALDNSFDKESFDYILLDAPCSGLGISRKHPDVLYVKDQSNFSEIIDLQGKILPEAFSLLKSGGVMMYSTCSLMKSEGERQIDRFLKNYKDAEIIDISEIFDSIGKVDSKGFFRTFPTEKVDGFFMALIRKK